MEGISATAFRGFRSYWRRRGYIRLRTAAGRSKACRILELPSTEPSRRRRRFWKFKLSPRLRLRFRFSPKKFLIGLRDAYVNAMVRLANSPAIGAGYRADGLAGFGSRPVKEYDERTIVEIYKAIVAAQGQIVPRDAAWVASAAAFRRSVKMAEEMNHRTSYVKLTKEQAPLEDIKPGELNMPIDVPQLHTRKCSECGQPLPESYQAPADEPWTSGIFDCAQDNESCRTGLLCPCVLFGRNFEQMKEDTPWTGPCICHAIFVEGGLALAATAAAVHGVIEPRTTFLILEGLLFSWWMCGIYTGLARQTLQKKYHLKNSPCDPCMVHCCLHWCALCQEHREMKARLADDSTFAMTVVNPPPVQEMTADAHSHELPSTSANGGSHIHEGMQPL